MEYPKYFYLWAKTDISNEVNKIHPLIYHMLDVAECLRFLWNEVLSKQTKSQFSEAINLDFNSTGAALTFWGALHDIGKAAPGFQGKYPQYIPVLQREGFVFPSTMNPTPAPHGILTAWSLSNLLPIDGLSKEDARQIAFAVGGHHGVWPTNDLVQLPALQKSDKGDELWEGVRKELYLAVREVCQPPKTVSLPQNLQKRNAFLTLFSGLVSVADWIGSMEERFHFEENFFTPKEYVQKIASPQARSAIIDLGWVGWQADGNFVNFSTMFPKITIPNEVQQKTFNAINGCKLPALVILEAPTGIGKTEAALYMADSWLQSQQGKGLYIAMPTQATSNQMFARVKQFLENRYPSQLINIHLMHSAALLEENDSTPQIRNISQDDQSSDANVKAELWFQPRKRTLLAPFGVGTVDQALMSVLQTRHFFVRMFGLGQKVVIFDEVHAYDTYMSILFQRLLSWLRTIGTSVILLSATLPEKTRVELVKAWGGFRGKANLTTAEYPRVTVVDAENVKCVSLPVTQRRTLNVVGIDSSPEVIAEHLEEKMNEGGCVAVICNRVKRAQEVYKAIKVRGFIDQENLILFHARFPFTWRKEIEDRVLSLFGKYDQKGSQVQRPLKAIVIATQVIEQSLDLDFDYMITDLAPIDLILQRAGRLHRHKQNNETRPKQFQNPILAITRNPEKNGLPEFGSDSRVYDEATLLRTWLVLDDRDLLLLPDDTMQLIEKVYGEELDHGGIDLDFQTRLDQLDEKTRLEQSKEIYQAVQRLIALPDDEDLITGRNEGLEEDDPTVNDAFRALTRLADPGVSLICLHETDKGIAFDVSGRGAPINLSKQPDREIARELLKCTVNVQRKDVVNFFVHQVHTPAEWRKLAAVRYHYPIVFDKNGECSPKGAKFKFKLTRELGLEVFNKEEE